MNNRLFFQVQNDFENYGQYKLGYCTKLKLKPSTVPKLSLNENCNVNCVENVDTIQVDSSCRSTCTFSVSDTTGDRSISGCSSEISSDVQSKNIIYSDSHSNADGVEESSQCVPVCGITFSCKPTKITSENINHQDRSNSLKTKIRQVMSCTVNNSSVLASPNSVNESQRAPVLADITNINKRESNNT